MEIIRNNVAGIEIGRKNVFTAVEGQPVVTHLTYTKEYLLLRDYLLKHNVQSVAMRVNYVYWIVLYDILEAAGIDVWLVDDGPFKQVPGRNPDLKDCEWIRQLHSWGMLKRTYVEDDEIQGLRTYLRIREDHINSSFIHLDYILEITASMSIRLDEIFQMHTASGMAIVEAILNGERDENALIKLCHSSILNKNRDELLKSLKGDYTDSALFILRDAYHIYLFGLAQLEEINEKIDQVIDRQRRKQD